MDNTDKRNLLEQTIEEIKDSGHAIKDISWIGSYDKEYAINWKKFKKIANIEYDSGFGGQEIAKDLVIVFKDGSWLNRTEYDGAESWGYIRNMNSSFPKNAKTFDKVGIGCWNKIKQLMERDD